MKICAIICEYNPFHNGHLYQLKEAKRLSNADAVLCLMSGNFVQRGENAILDKFTRAKHALLAGADVVVELPVPFACSSAEIFAQGAVKILSSIPAVTHLCFGAEHADKQAFLDAATLLLNEPKEISVKIQSSLAKGLSYAKARANAYENPLLNNPNDILGVEYTKAILKRDAKIDILPIPRIGGGYNEKRLTDSFPSATAIRESLQQGRRVDTQPYLPNFVYDDLQVKFCDKLDALEKAAILQKSLAQLRTICDCNEGLENAFKKAAENSAPLVQTLTNARYTSARIRRIALHALLNITKHDVDLFLSNDLYIYPLAYRRDSKKVLAALSEAKFPLLTGAPALKNLSNAAIGCRELNNFADKMYAILRGTSYQSNVVIL